MKEQTAVEWLYDKFLFAGHAVPSQWKEQAKAMEKEQICNAYWASYEEGQYSGDKTAEEYYKQTFNPQDDGYSNFNL
jgi:hypothetical protein